MWRLGLLRDGRGLPDAVRPDAGQGSGQGGGWSVVPTPNPARLRNGTFTADSCTSQSACTAVGSYVNAAGVTVTAAERWDGRAWRVQATPEPAGAVASLLNGVSCTSASACTAVGYYFTAAGGVLTLAEGWDGTGWQIQPSAGPVGVASGLFAVSCTSARACIAVGVYDNASDTSLALAERWNGSSWSVQATPISVVAVPAELLGVSCTGPGACAAVGAFDNSQGTSEPLAMTWNGATWHDQAVPSRASWTGSGLSAVSCTSAGTCMAAGGFTRSTGESESLAEYWNGTNWAIQAVPGPHGSGGSQLFGVSCATPDGCVAAGAYLSGGAARPASGGAAGTVRPLAEIWDGAAWEVSPVAIPKGNSGGGFGAISCAAKRGCTAAGSYTPGISVSAVTLAESWNGTRWTLQASPSPAGANASEFTADSCTSARACTAVGFYLKNLTVLDTLAESWNGSVWRIQPTPNPRGMTTSFFHALSCVSARACIAVGGASGNSGIPVPLAESWNGSRWTIQPVPRPAHGRGLALYSISCSSARACTAVGFYNGSGGRAAGLAERWNGSRWRIQAVLTPAKRTWLYGVACPSARSCVAVGYQNNGTGNARPLAESWNGRSWHTQHLPLPHGSPGGALSAVSCTAPGACTAVGTSFSSTGQPLAERWNGTSWQSETTVAPDGYQASVSEISLAGVSCSSATTCTAVGDYAPGNAAETFAEAWDGTSWRLEFVALPPGTEQALMNGVSCARPTCTAVGADFGPSGAIVTLADVAPSG